MIKDLLKPPDLICPSCKSRAVPWWDGLLRSRANLVIARLLSRLTRRVMKIRARCATCQRYFSHLHTLERTVVGYHGCKRSFAVEMVTGRLTPQQWEPSRKPWDWLGEGVYFWEHAPGRAWQWAHQWHPKEPAVLAAEIRLGRCLDLADTAFVPLLQQAYEGTVTMYEAVGKRLPQNQDTPPLRRLDRVVIDRLTRTTDKPRSVHYQTVRAPFEEGEPAYPGAKIRTQSHIQIAVRDPACIISPIYMVDREGDGV